MTSAGEDSSVTQAELRVDIIIPVHTELVVVKACLESVFASTNELLGDILVVDDQSPDPETSAYLAELAATHKIVLHVNERNEGFVHSVVRAAKVNTNRDFVILNSDTRVANSWLDRLAHHARLTGEDRKVATVTPFSNNATIASYPVMGAVNRFPKDGDVAGLDEVFAAVNPGQSVTMPTGVGFCMFIARAAWEDVGGFDLGYGRGYGEEVDLCCALASRGWQHLLAADVFVFHEGGASFGGGAEQLKVAAQKVVDERYPDYPTDVATWIKSDPALPLRMRVDLARLSRGGKNRLLFVSHSMGGGVQQHVDELTRLLTESGDSEVFLLSPVGINGIRLQWLREGTHLEWMFDADSGAQEVFDVCRLLQFARVHFHHFKGLPRWVLQLPAELHLPYDVTIHDFHTACPQVSFLDKDEQYCGRPLVAECRKCVTERPDQWGLGIDDWRRQFGGVLANASRTICPTPAVAAIMEDYFPGVAVEVWPHPDIESAQYVGHVGRSLSTRKIALLGTLSPLKGLDLLESVAQLSEKGDANLHFRIIGATTHPLKPDTGTNVSIYGQFDRELLPEILAVERPDAFLLLSRVPETFSYALSIAMSTGLPVIALDNGAIGERLAGYSHGRLLGANATPDEVLRAVDEISSAYESSAHQSRAVNAQEHGRAYLAQYLQGPETQEKDLTLSDEEYDRLVDSARVKVDLLSAEYPIERVIEAAIDCRQTESLIQLKHQASANERDLRVARQHLEIRAVEVDHLKFVIDEVKAANDVHVTALENRIEEQTETLRERDEAITHLEKNLATRQAKIEEILSSTSWKLTAPARYLMTRSRSALKPVANSVRKLRRLFVFIRYHYSVGGLPGLFSSLKRRLSRSAGGSESKTQSDMLAAGALLIDTAEPAYLATSDQPKVSIIIPSYGQHATTANCLRSLALNPPGMPFEVVVVDDAFKTPFLQSDFGIEGAIVIRNEENLGFLRTCNKAVEATTGEFFVLLNNDTLVHRGAIDALLATFEKLTQVGAVGAKLLFEDGSLQEAGGIVWRDGSAWNWGRNERADDPRFNYLRDADYCSAAALMISRQAWMDVGGFDEAYVPAYYEDTDFCFALREQGYRVLYQPAAVVTHLEGISHGTSTSEGLKAHQVTNAKRFREKWDRRLAHHAPNGHRPMLERDRPVKARILWVEACVLTPDQDSGSLRTFRLLRILMNLGCKVTFVADNLQNHQPYVGQLQAEGVEVLYAPSVTSVSNYIAAFGGDYDVITLCRHYIAIKYIDQIRRQHPGVKVWFDTIDLHYLRLQRQFALDGKTSTKALSELAYEEEIAVITKSDVTIVVSDVEVAELKEKVPAAKIAVVSNIHEVAGDVPTFSAREHVMFVGGFQHPPNVDAVEFFAREIWPDFSRSNPRVKAYIIGSKMPDSLRQLGEAAGIDMLGFVEDLTPYYEQCVMAVAPLRYGAGVKGKVNQALSFGLPVVGTSAALEGMGLESGQEAMLANTPAEFVAAMNEVISDSALWSRLSVNGKASLSRSFSTEVAASALKEMLVDVID